MLYILYSLKSIGYPGFQLGQTMSKLNKNKGTFVVLLYDWIHGKRVVSLRTESQKYKRHNRHHCSCCCRNITFWRHNLECILRDVLKIAVKPRLTEQHWDKAKKYPDKASCRDLTSFLIGYNDWKKQRVGPEKNRDFMRIMVYHGIRYPEFPVES